MALIIPTSATTYGDSTQLPGGRMRRYVLAQFRTNADLEWVRILRGCLLKDELKYKDFEVNRHRFQADRRLWARVEAGVGQASVIVIDPGDVENVFIYGAVHGRLDKEVLYDRDLRFRSCVAALINWTPIAYLPYKIAQSVPWGLYDPVTSIADFAPAAIQRSIGRSLRSATIFAARAHAAFDIAELPPGTRSTQDLLCSPLSEAILAEVISTERAFDVEDTATLKVLNAAADQIAVALTARLPNLLIDRAAVLAREVDSRAVDELQAADIAAGWAREMISLGAREALPQRFERVWWNGNLMR